MRETTPGTETSGEGRGLIAVCLATFDPEPGLLRRQLDSLRAQTDSNWVCVISDDCSRQERFSAIEKEVDADPRFVVSRSDRRLGFYLNFERALRLAPPQAELIALCDQDDYWRPDKLATLRAAIGDAPLAYSDARLIDASGRVLSEAIWPGRRINRSSVASTLIAHTVPGASALMRRDVVELGLPFPRVPGWPFHDRWLAAVAVCRGPLTYVRRPLYDYVQHSDAVLRGRIGWGPAEGHTQHGPSAMLERGRQRYFYAYEPVRVYAMALEERAAATDERGRRDLRRLASADTSLLSLAWLALRLLRPLLGANETLGYERVLLTGLLWRRLSGLAARLGRDRGPLQPVPPPMDLEALGPPPIRGRRSRLRLLARARQRGAVDSG